MTKNRLLKPKYDVVFRALFGENNKSLTEKFISDILGQNVKIKDFLDRHVSTKSADDKLAIMDYRVKLEDNTICHIEIQLNEHDYEIERFLLYLSNIYARQLKIGDEYTKINRAISIVILDHEIEELKGLEKLDVKWQMRDNITGKKLLTDKFEMCIIELPKAKRLYAKEGKDKLCDWMVFLDDPNSKEVIKIMEENENIKEAVERLEYVSDDEELRRLAELREMSRREENAVKAFVRRKGYEEGYEMGIKNGRKDGIKQGIKEGIEQGIQQGVEQNNKRTVKKMLDENIDVDVIQRITGLSKEQIFKLK